MCQSVEAQLFDIQYEIAPTISIVVNDIMQVHYENSPRPLYSIEITETDPSVLGSHPPGFMPMSIVGAAMDPPPGFSPVNIHG